MHYIIFVFLLMSFGSQQVLQAQPESPISWHTSATQLADKEFLLTFEAEIQQGWYLYSQNLEGIGPVPTSIRFNKPRKIELQGQIEEIGQAISEQDPIFEKVITKYAKSVSFQAHVITKKDEQNLSGTIEFMSCNSNRCLPPQDYAFKFKLVNQSLPDPFAQTLNTIPDFGYLESQRYAASEHIPPGDKQLFITDPTVIISNQDVIDNSALVEDFAHEQKRIEINADRTISLQETDNLVIDNIGKYLASTSPKEAIEVDVALDEPILQLNEKVSPTPLAQLLNEVKSPTKTDKGTKPTLPKQQEQVTITTPKDLLWNLAIHPANSTEKGHYTLVFTTPLPQGQAFSTAPTFTFDKNEGYQLQGGIQHAVLKDSIQQFTQQVRFTDNVLLTGQMQYDLTANDKIFNKTYNFVFNQDGAVVTTQSLSPFIAIGVTVVILVASLLLYLVRKNKSLEDKATKSIK